MKDKKNWPHTDQGMEARQRVHPFSYQLDINPYVLAPMAGITDKAMRLTCREFGCGLQVTEMVSAKALTYANQRSLDLMDLRDEEAPVIVQLFGSEAEVLAEGASIAVAHGAQALDINMGCPVPKVAGHGEGAALLKNPLQATALAEAVCRAVSVPVSVKMRIGWEAPDPSLGDFAKRLESVGVQLIAVHGRTRSQYYSGSANWAAIAQVVSAVDIPVLANGDVWQVKDAIKILDVTGAAGVMVGRGALGRPWIFQALRNKDAHFKDPDLSTRCAIMRRHASLAVQYEGERIAMQKMRKHIAWYLKGLHGAAQWRNRAMQINTLTDLDQLLMSMV